MTFDVDQDRVCLNLSILDDKINEGTEDIEVRITGVPPGVSTGQPQRTIVSIIDDDSELQQCTHLLLICCNFLT